jgi:D-alanyl-D-alanine carboxypeptidase
MGWAFAAGQIYSTVNDLWLLHRAAVGGKILSDAGWLRIHTAKSGFGCDIRQFRGQKAVRNYGRIQGFSSYVLNLPEQKVFVATLSNCEDDSLEPLVEDLAAIVLGQSYATPKATRHITKSLSTDKLERFIGRFQTGPRTTTQVFRDGADLKVELADRPTVKLIPISESTFLIEATETEVSFPTDADGNIEAITIRGKEGTLQGTRVDR